MYGSLKEFLYFGYLPSAGARLPIELPLEQPSMASARLLDLIPRAQKAWTSAVREILDGTPAGTTHFVPISGGLDSRLILSELLRNLDTREIITVTFGEPGAWDFEIGQLVASRAGVRNLPLSGQDIDWSAEELQRFAARLSHPVPILEAYVNATSLHAADDCQSLVWSGYLGDPLAGSHLPKQPLSNAASVSQFISANRYTRRFESLTPEAARATLPTIPRGPLEATEWLDLAVRQSLYIAPSLFSLPRNYALPFTRPSWVNFSLSVPRELRVGQRLYKQFLLHQHSELFSLPTKINRGLPLGASSLRRTFRFALHAAHRLLGGATNAGANYFTYGDLFRKDSRFAEAVNGLLSDLNTRRALPFDPRDVPSTGDWSATLLLVSAELFLEAGALSIEHSGSITWP